MQIEESKIVREVLKDLARSAKIGYVNTLNRFVNEFVKGKTIDGLVEEAKTDVRKTQQRIHDFYKWLQNEKRLKESSAYVIAYGYLRGFFVNLDVTFQKKWMKSIPKVKRARKALKRDKVYTFFDVDEKTRTIRFNRERMQQFLSNLKLRDVAITLALLSSSQDSGDLFKLNIGDISEQENHRIFWEGNRQKTDVLFRTFFSKEAARIIRRYFQQERPGAGDEDPLFVYITRHRGQEKPIEERMSPSCLASIYRDAARKMGIKWENGEHNPLRPKRMRHLFRTACDTAGITELYTNAYMGHKNHQGQDYSEFSKAVLELEYLRVEPFLTVYGEVEESLEIKEDVRKLENRIAELNNEIRFLRDHIGQIARDAVQMELKMLYGEDYESLQETYRWQKEFMRREREKSST